MWKPVLDAIRVLGNISTSVLLFIAFEEVLLIVQRPASSKLQYMGMLLLCIFVFYMDHQLVRIQAIGQDIAIGCHFNLCKHLCSHCAIVRLVVVLKSAGSTELSFQPTHESNRA